MRKYYLCFFIPHIYTLRQYYNCQIRNTDGVGLAYNNIHIHRNNTIYNDIRYIHINIYISYKKIIIKYSYSIINQKK